MDNLKEHLKDTILNNRPKLSANSVKIYVSTLFNLYKKLEGKDFKFFDNDKLILEKLNDKSPNIRKSILSALYILTNNDKYKEIMLQDCNVVNDYYKQQRMNKTEKDNWIPFEDIQLKYNELLNEVEAMIFGRKILLKIKTIIYFLLVALMSGAGNIAPRRSLDYSEMKIRNFDPKTDNYYKSGKMVFNNYKTKDIYGTAVVNIAEKNPILNKIIKKWISINEGDYLLVSSTGAKLSTPQISQYNNKIWGRNISTDMYRHIFLTHMYKGKSMPSFEEMERLATEMGHSINQALKYIKNDAPDATK